MSTELLVFHLAFLRNGGKVNLKVMYIYTLDMILINMDM